ncbi:phasin [Stappia sp. F7233]|uniref:Phasin n=1 Tax=Stappia albiluteola TaxID=2758565 RepID=A0A839AH25_9HYPH|nr:phasin [Stappia albiluteola]MBA5778338.1 phasin [Stappia albiluteola]
MTETTVAKAPRAKSTKSAAAKAAFPNFEAFSMPNLEVPAAAREMAEKSIEQARDAYAKVKTVAEDATDLLEDTFESTRQGALDFQFKALDAAKANTDATFKFMKDVLGAKTVAEVIELQSSFARSQFDAVSGQVKDLQDFSVKVATEVGEPVKAAFEKSFSAFKAA